MGENSIIGQYYLILITQNIKDQENKKYFKNISTPLSTLSITVTLTSSPQPPRRHHAALSSSPLLNLLLSLIYEIQSTAVIFPHHQPSQCHTMSTIIAFPLLFSLISKIYNIAITFHHYCLSQLISSLCLSLNKVFLFLFLM